MSGFPAMDITMQEIKAGQDFQHVDMEAGGTDGVPPSLSTDLHRTLPHIVSV
jgi:hypothetical protein